MDSVKIERDARVVADDGDVGHVSHVIVDPATREVTNIVVHRDGDDWIVPMSAVEHVEGKTVRVQGERARYASARPFNREQFHAVDEDEARLDSARVAEHGGAPLLDAERDAVEVGGVTSPSYAAAPLAGDAPVQTGQTTEWPAGEQGPYRLQLKEERLRVETAEEQAGSVRLTRRVVERIETIPVPVREERLIIEVVPGSGTVRIGDRTLSEGESIEVLLHEERVITSKEVIVSEDILIRKEIVEREERIQETLRREELVVDEAGQLERTESPVDPADQRGAGR